MSIRENVPNGVENVVKRKTALGFDGMYRVCHVPWSVNGKLPDCTVRNRLNDEDMWTELSVEEADNRGFRLCDLCRGVDRPNPHEGIASRLEDMDPDIEIR